MTANGQGFAETNGIRTFYDVRGDGPWLVMSNSLACDHSMWDAQADVFARTFRVLRYDIRGHGRSDAGEAAYVPDTLFQDLHALFDAHGIDKAHFVGLSMGGLLGQAFALNWPERLKSLVICDTSSKFPDAVAPEWDRRIALGRSQGMEALVAPTLERWFTPRFRTRRPDAMAHFGRQIASTSIEGYAGCSKAILTMDFRHRLADIGTPTLVVVGADDVGTPVSMARALNEGIAGSRLAIIPDAAHFPNVEQTDIFNEQVLGFLRERQAASA